MEKFASERESQDEILWYLIKKYVIRKKKENKYVINEIWHSYQSQWKQQNSL